VIPDEVRERQRELAERAEPFVTATVVRVQRPTSAAAGNVALVRADGGLEGFVGGVCAQHSVRLYSLKVMESGEPLLLKIVPDPAEQDPENAPVTDGHVIATDEGSVTVRNPCLSGGAIEVFLEPTLPAPRVLVVGDSPIAGALQRIGPMVDVEIVASAGRRDPVQVADGDLALVVAAHGRDELEALRAGVRAGLPYVGLVASPKRGAAVLEELRGLGVDADAVERIETPAGIEIGASTPGEVAIAILARIVAVRRGAAAAAPSPAATVLPITAAAGAGASSQPTPAKPATTAQTAVDPICGMTVVIDADTPSAQRDGETFYFCCDGCQRTFEQQAA
jgi:xanthine dehydrogenase accessory factor